MAPILSKPKFTRELYVMCPNRVRGSWKSCWNSEAAACARRRS
eukprot:CAMPEP_0194675414 /NCGR_PEP_ID=MMETSP0295-20121207/8249_1 /TAXON_ID=39354 /ORGANISM="Heterosigma akashiwo, Strain CCMP2393" /LENGTH=42 /DNA_ID= /DNA_START= /DNA_END= /DNA_ORIENTATION=